MYVYQFPNHYVGEMFIQCSVHKLWIEDTLSSAHKEVEINACIPFNAFGYLPFRIFHSITPDRSVWQGNIQYIELKCILNALMLELMSYANEPLEVGIIQNQYKQLHQNVWLCLVCVVMPPLLYRDDNI